LGETLTAKDLTKFAYGVAKGMEFLVSKGVSSPRDPIGCDVMRGAPSAHGVPSNGMASRKTECKALIDYYPTARQRIRVPCEVFLPCGCQEVTS